MKKLSVLMMIGLVSWACQSEPPAPDRERSFLLNVTINTWDDLSKVHLEMVGPSGDLADYLDQHITRSDSANTILACQYQTLHHMATNDERAFSDLVHEVRRGTPLLVEHSGGRLVSQHPKLLSLLGWEATGGQRLEAGCLDHSGLMHHYREVPLVRMLPETEVIARHPESPGMLLHGNVLSVLGKVDGRDGSVITGFARLGRARALSVHVHGRLEPLDDRGRSLWVTLTSEALLDEEVDVEIDWPGGQSILHRGVRLSRRHPRTLNMEVPAMPGGDEEYLVKIIRSNQVVATHSIRSNRPLSLSLLNNSVERQRTGDPCKLYFASPDDLECTIEVTGLPEGGFLRQMSFVDGRSEVHVSDSLPEGVYDLNITLFNQDRVPLGDFHTQVLSGAGELPVVGQGGQGYVMGSDRRCEVLDLDPIIAQVVSIEDQEERQAVLSQAVRQSFDAVANQSQQMLLILSFQGQSDDHKHALDICAKRQSAYADTQVLVDGPFQQDHFPALTAWPGSFPSETAWVDGRGMGLADQVRALRPGTHGLIVDGLKTDPAIGALDPWLNQSRLTQMPLARVFAPGLAAHQPAVAGMVRLLEDLGFAVDMRDELDHSEGLQVVACPAMEQVSPLHRAQLATLKEQGVILLGGSMGEVPADSEGLRSLFGGHLVNDLIPARYPLVWKDSDKRLDAGGCLRLIDSPGCDVMARVSSTGAPAMILRRDNLGGTLLTGINLGRYYHLTSDPTLLQVVADLTGQNPRDQFLVRRFETSRGLITLVINPTPRDRIFNLSARTHVVTHTHGVENVLVIPAQDVAVLMTEGL